MLNAVWVAVIVAAFCWAVLVAAAVFVLVKLARLINQTSAAVTGLRASSDALIDRAHATLDATAGQLSRTDEITASMDEVAGNMAELTGRVTQFAPLARLAAAQAGSRFARVSAFALRRPARRPSCGGGPGSDPAVKPPRERASAGAAMIRRVFWLTLGAALGISGYRRATALARAITARPAGPGDHQLRRGRA